MDTQWFYWMDGRQTGPLGEAELKQMAASGTLRPEHLIWNSSLTEWKAAGEVTNWNFGPAPLPPSAPPPVCDGAQVQPLAYVARSDEPLVLSPRLIDLLRKTAPWVRFLGVLAYIFAGISVVMGLVMISVTSSRPVPGVPGIGIGAVYLIMAIIYIFPAGYLNRYASRIGRLARMKRTIDLEEAIDAQRAFWKFCGMTALVVIGLYFIGIAVAIGFSVVHR